MTAPATVDADRVHALNRLIREKTGRVESGPEHVVSARKNLWLQVPPVEIGSTSSQSWHARRRQRAPLAPDNGATRDGAIAKRVRRLLTLLLSAALLLATAATAVDLLNTESRVADPVQTVPGPALQRAAVAAPVTALDMKVRDLRNENQKLRERLRDLERRLRSEAR